jgi:hypothetical protein
MKTTKRVRCNSNTKAADVQIQKRSGNVFPGKIPKAAREYVGALKIEVRGEDGELLGVYDVPESISAKAIFAAQMFCGGDLASFVEEGVLGAVMALLGFTEGTAEPVAVQLFKARNAFAAKSLNEFKAAVRVYGALSEAEMASRSAELRKEAEILYRAAETQRRMRQHMESVALS